MVPPEEENTAGFYAGLPSPRLYGAMCFALLLVTYIATNVTICGSVQALLLVTYIPAISLWLPGLLK